MIQFEALPQIRVVLVDDHPLALAGITALLNTQPQIEVAAAVGDGAAALAALADSTPDILLLDLRLPGMSGVEVARQARQLFPRLAILVLTASDEYADVFALQQIGVNGYLSKDVTGDQLIAAIQTAVREPAERALAQYPLPFTFQGMLSGREQALLELLAMGASNQQIAQQLGRSVKTVEYHISHLLKKFGARSRLDLIRKAIQQGLVQGKQPDETDS